MSKSQLCQQFVHGTYQEDDEFELIETLVDLRAEDCLCVFSLKTPCKKQSVTPFGLCNAHFKTKKGTDLAIKWNSLLEELEIEESDEEEETIELIEEETVEEPKEEAKPKAKEEPKPQPKAKEEPKPQPKAKEEAKPQPKAKEEAKPQAKAKEEAKEEPKVVKEEVVKEEPKEDPKPKPKPRAVKAKPKEEPKEEPKEQDESDSGVARYVAQNSEEDGSYTPVTKPRPKLRFERSQFGNFINKETKLVLRHRDRVILGVENEDGTIDALDDDQIQFCEEHNLDYVKL